MLVTYRVCEDDPTRICDRTVSCGEMWSGENPLVVPTRLSEGAPGLKGAGEGQPCQLFLLSLCLWTLDQLFHLLAIWHFCSLCLPFPRQPFALQLCCSFEHLFLAFFGGGVSDNLASYFTEKQQRNFHTTSLPVCIFTHNHPHVLLWIVWYSIFELRLLQLRPCLPGSVDQWLHCWCPPHTFFSFVKAWSC